MAHLTAADVGPLNLDHAERAHRLQLAGETLDYLPALLVFTDVLHERVLNNPPEPRAELTAAFLAARGLIRPTDEEAARILAERGFRISAAPQKRPHFRGIGRILSAADFEDRRARLPPRKSYGWCMAGDRP